MSIGKAEELSLEGCGWRHGYSRRSLAFRPKQFVCEAVLGLDPAATDRSSVGLVLTEYELCREQRPGDPSILIDRAIAQISQHDDHGSILDLTVAISFDNPPSFAY